MIDRETAGKQWNRLVALAWADDKLRARLVRDPSAVLKEHGIELPAGVDVRLHENSQNTINLVLPTKPAREIAEIRHAEQADPSYFYSIF